MSKLVSAYANGPSKDGADTPFLATLREEFPELTAALLGTKTVEGTCLLPPCTLMLFLDNDRLGWCLSPKTGSKVCFGSVPDPSKGLAGVEHELTEGHFEWKQKRGR